MLFTTVFVTIISILATAAAVYYIVRTVRQQLKLYYSIQLVVLKTARLHFLFAAGVFGAASVLCFVLLEPVLLSLPVMLLSLCVLNCVFFFAKSAIVDRGIQTTDRFIGWHRLYYYLVDEDKEKVLFSLTKKGPYTLLDTVGAFSFDRADLDKIKFILNKNKNKFVKHYDVR